MRTAIVTGDYFRPGQTFVNRHVEHLFGGDTCVIADGATGEEPYPDLPRLIRRQVPRGPGERAAAPFRMAVNRLTLGTSRIPAGRERAALAVFLREQRVERILCEFGTQSLAMHGLARDLGIPCFGYFRGTDASTALRQPGRVRGYRRMLPHLAGVIAVSRFLLDNLATRGLTHPNAHVIPSGVDIRRFRPGAKAARRFLAVGRLVEKKAPDITLRAFADGTRGAPEARLAMIGDGPLMDRCRALADELGVADRVSFPGAQPHDAVRAALAETGVFLQHSVTGANGNTEGLPTSIQEALASGCIVLSTRHAGIPEAVEDGVNGWLCAERDGPAFAGLIRRTLSLDGAAMAAMADAARGTAEARFDNAALLHRLETVLREGAITRH